MDESSYCVLVFLVPVNEIVHSRHIATENSLIDRYGKRKGTRGWLERYGGLAKKKTFPSLKSSFRTDDHDNHFQSITSSEHQLNTKVLLISFWLKNIIPIVRAPRKKNLAIPTRSEKWIVSHRKENNLNFSNFRLAFDSPSSFHLSLFKFCRRRGRPASFYCFMCLKNSQLNDWRVHCSHFTVLSIPTRIFRRCVVNVALTCNCLLLTYWKCWRAYRNICRTYFKYSNNRLILL
jgi:hypothetical protein